MRRTVIALTAALGVAAALSGLPGPASAQAQGQQMMQRACQNLTQSECAVLQEQVRLLRSGQTTIDDAKAEMCAAKQDVPCPTIERQIDALLERLPDGALPASVYGSGQQGMRSTSPAAREEAASESGTAATDAGDETTVRALTMTMPERIEILNRLAPDGEGLSCLEPGSDDCRTRFADRSESVLADLDRESLDAQDAEGAEILEIWLDATENGTRPEPDPEAYLAARGAETETRQITERTARTSGQERAANAAAVARIAGIPVERITPGAELEGVRVVRVEDERVVIRAADRLRVLHDPDTLLRRPGTRLEIEKGGGGRAYTTTVTRPGGTQVISRYDWKGELAYRARVAPSGQRTVLLDEREERMGGEAGRDGDALGRALADAERNRARAERPMLWQVRQQPQIRAQAPRLAGQDIVFASGSAVVTPNQANRLAEIGRQVRTILQRNPAALFLVEGHTDAVGDAAANLVLSDRRAESVALALIEYYDVPPENLLFQGYGEAFPAVEASGDQRQNRRTVVRNITPVLGPQG